MDDQKLQAEVKRVSNLKQNKNLGEDQITKIAKLNLKLANFNSQPLFDIDSLDEKIKAEAIKDQELAEVKFRSYLDAHEIESYSDLDTLKNLIYNDILLTRLQREISKSSTPPQKLTEQMVLIQEEINNFKIKLGIDKDGAEATELNQLQKLTKRFEKYINENKNEFTIASGCCGKMLLLRRRVKDFDCVSHPWFLGRWYFNYEILKDVKNGIITKDQAWRYLCAAGTGSNYKPAFSKDYCSDYVQYCLDNWNTIMEHFDGKN